MLTAEKSSSLIPRSSAFTAWRRALVRAWWVLVCGAGGTLSSARADVVTEYQVKAAFLFNFTKFVEWPPDRFADSETPIVIAVLGRNPFGDELENLVRNRLVNGRRIVIRLLASVEDVKSSPGDFHVL